VARLHPKPEPVERHQELTLPKFKAAVAALSQSLDLSTDQSTRLLESLRTRPQWLYLDEVKRYQNIDPDVLDAAGVELEINPGSERVSLKRKKLLGKAKAVPLVLDRDAAMFIATGRNKWSLCTGAEKRKTHRMMKEFFSKRVVTNTAGKPNYPYTRAVLEIIKTIETATGSAFRFTRDTYSRLGGEEFELLVATLDLWLFASRVPSRETLATIIQREYRTC
jgi:hypothetical protein